MCYAVTTCWFVETYAEFTFAQLKFKGENSAYVSLLNMMYWCCLMSSEGERFGQGIRCTSDVQSGSQVEILSQGT